jgi:ParB family chromosome partitioning protein
MPAGTAKNLTTSLSEEWYTPSWLLNRIRRVLGGVINLDPASCAIANERVRADRFYTKEQNGLALPWLANTVYLNPPFGKVGRESIAGAWADTFFTKYCAGEFEAGVLLTRAACGTGWFSKYARTQVCMVLDDRVQFMEPTGSNKAGQTVGTALFYVGPNPALFVEQLEDKAWPNGVAQRAALQA